MAVIQKIRSYGVVLICIVGLALFAFIAEELVRAISTTHNVGRQTVGQIYGKDVSYQEFNELYDEYENAVKMGNGAQNLTESQTIQLRDQVWNDLVSQRIVEHEAEALGLIVTDAEVQTLINTGQSAILRQTPFINQQTGAFDAQLLKQFLSNYEEVMGNAEYPESQKESFEQLMKYWRFIEKQVRQQALAQKYQALLASLMITNPVSAKASFDARQNESTALVAAIPYSAIKDQDIKATQEDIKSKYDEMKHQYPDMFDMQQEARSIKYINVSITASEADEAELQKELTEYAQQMEAPEQVAQTVRESRSSVSYSSLPVSIKSLPSDIAHELDSMSVGEMKGPYANRQDNTMNLIKLIAKVQLPDSVEFRRIDVPGTDAAAKKTADSIYTALQQGAVIDSVAKKYNQTGQAQWLTSVMVDGAQFNDENRDFVNTILTSPAGSIQKVSTQQGTIILNVTDRKNIITKYDVAVIKRQIDFSEETHNKVWNEFASFIAANKTIEDMEANASAKGYTVRESQYLGAGSHYIGGLQGTTEALRWTFDKAKKGDVSELYECGATNNELLVVALTDIHKTGKRDINDPNLKMMLEQEVLKDKKAAQIIEKMEGAKSVADVAKIPGAVTDTIGSITFSAPTFVYKLASSEPILSGAVSATKKGDFVNAVKGEGGVYAFQVLNKSTKPGKLDTKVESQQLSATYTRNLSALMNVLSRKANLKDNRYKFYQ